MTVEHVGPGRWLAEGKDGTVIGVYASRGAAGMAVREWDKHRTKPDGAVKPIILIGPPPTGQGR